LTDQIDQTFMILLSLCAVESLMERHAEAKGFRFALTTNNSGDIESVKPNLLAAKVSAYPGSPQIFKKDRMHLASNPARHRYICFAAPTFVSGQHTPLESLPGVELICVDLADGIASGKKTRLVKTS
jgi:hypothetical protein